MSASSVFPASAHHYVRSLTWADRRSAGKVYTPSPLADLIVSRALDAHAQLGKGAVLDPAVGGGAFLEVLVKRLHAEHVAPRKRRPNRDAFLTLVEKSVFGIDIDKKAAALAREAVATMVQTLAPGPLPGGFLSRNIAVGDFLLDPVVEDLGLDGRLGLIVGNPPYVSATRLGSSYKERLRQRFATATGRLDLYMAFMEKAASVLEDEGVLAFVTPDKYLTSQSARLLRRHLQESGTVVSLTLFSSHSLFENADTVPCISVWRKGTSRARTFEVQRWETNPGLGVLPARPPERLPAKRLRGEVWDVTSERTNRMLEQLRRGHPRLQSLVSRVSAGIATGLDSAFRMAPNDRTSVEDSLLYTAIRGRDVRPYMIESTGERLFVPYTFDEAGRARLIDIDAFPGAREWLTPHRARLERRHCVRVWGKPWYAFHDPVLFDLAAVPKILLPDVSLTNRFALEPGSAIPLHSCYYIIPTGIDHGFLTAVLNSRPLEFIIRATAPRVKDGFRRYRAQFLLDLPIPIPDSQTSATIVSALQHQESEQVDRAVLRLFGVSLTELNDAFAAIECEGTSSLAEVVDAS